LPILEQRRLKGGNRLSLLGDRLERIFAQAQAMGVESDESTRLLVHQSPSPDMPEEPPLPRPAVVPNMVRNFWSLTQARNSLEYHLESVLGRPRGSVDAAYSPRSMLQEWYESLRHYSGPGWPSDIRFLKVHHRTASGAGENYSFNLRNDLR
jgi:hypothetical protein